MAGAADVPSLGSWIVPPGDDTVYVNGLRPVSIFDAKARAKAFASLSHDEVYSPVSDAGASSIEWALERQSLSWTISVFYNSVRSISFRNIPPFTSPEFQAYEKDKDKLDVRDSNLASLVAFLDENMWRSNPEDYEGVGAANVYRADGFASRALLLIHNFTDRLMPLDNTLFLSGMLNRVMSSIPLVGIRRMRRVLHHARWFHGRRQVQLGFGEASF